MGGQQQEHTRANALPTPSPAAVSQCHVDSHASSVDDAMNGV
jgi:hypothetical protein